MANTNWHIYLAIFKVQYMHQTEGALSDGMLYGKKKNAPKNLLEGFPLRNPDMMRTIVMKSSMLRFDRCRWNAQVRTINAPYKKKVSTVSRAHTTLQKEACDAQ